MFNTVSELYNDFLGIDFDEYYKLPNAKIIKSKSRNTIQVSYFLKHKIMMFSLKMKNRLIKKTGW